MSKYFFNRLFKKPKDSELEAKEKRRKFIARGWCEYNGIFAYQFNTEEEIDKYYQERFNEQNNPYVFTPLAALLAHIYDEVVSK